LNILEASVKGGCPGVCVTEGISDYCEAILTIDNLCKPGLKCCVSSDTYGDKLPPNIIIPNKTKSNVTKSVPVTSPKPTYITTEIARVPVATHPSIINNSKPCKGECISGLIALFCDDIDVDAYCPNDESCCITTYVRST
jgi:plasma kallikrein